MKKIAFITSAFLTFFNVAAQKVEKITLNCGNNKININAEKVYQNNYSDTYVRVSKDSLFYYYVYKSADKPQSVKIQELALDDVNTDVDNEISFKTGFTKEKNGTTSLRIYNKGFKELIKITEINCNGVRKERKIGALIITCSSESIAQNILNKALRKPSGAATNSNATAAANTPATRTSFKCGETSYVFNNGTGKAKYAAINTSANGAFSTEYYGLVREEQGKGFVYFYQIYTSKTEPTKLLEAKIPFGYAVQNIGEVKKSSYGNDFEIKIGGYDDVIETTEVSCGDAPKKRKTTSAFLYFLTQKDAEDFRKALLGK